MADLTSRQRAETPQSGDLKLIAELREQIADLRKNETYRGLELRLPPAGPAFEGKVAKVLKELHQEGNREDIRTKSAFSEASLVSLGKTSEKTVA